MKLLVSLLWIASSPPYDTNFPARAWAELFDLADPERGGARRIADALIWLEHETFVEVDRSPGRPPVVRLKKEDGSGDDYIVPAKAPKDPNTGRLAWSDWYFRLPPTLWSKGWMATLSGAGLALLLVLADLGADEARDKWVSPSRARLLYEISEDTWTKGTKELAGLGLVHVGRDVVKTGDFDWKRLRNTYTLQAWRLDSYPWEGWEAVI